MAVWFIALWALPIEVIFSNTPGHSAEKECSGLINVGGYWFKRGVGHCLHCFSPVEVTLYLRIEMVRTRTCASDFSFDKGPIKRFSVCI
jgi:hypothetical protein